MVECNEWKFNKYKIIIVLNIYIIIGVCVVCIVLLVVVIIFIGLEVRLNFILLVWYFLWNVFIVLMIWVIVCVLWFFINRMIGIIE